MNLKTNIIEWIKNYSKENGDLKLIVGISGGIDSATVSTLCALTGIETHVVSLPILQKEEQLLLANNHIKWLTENFSNVVAHEQDLTEIFLNFKEKLNSYDDNLGWANTRSRLRMVTLYLISNFYKGIVVGTGNKVEDFGVGFFTKYGDGGVDISPIADLTKTEVRILAKELGIIDGILNAEPTDGLWEDDRTDEIQIGASYEELEWAMKFQEELDDRKKEVLKIFEKFKKQNEHKMKPIPIFKKNEDSKLNNKGIYLFQELFKEKNPERENEYLFCINKNLSNPIVNKIFYVLNEEEYNENKEYFDKLKSTYFVNSHKIEFIISKQQRFTFNQMVDFSKTYVEENRIVLIANLDVFIPESDDWKNIYDDFFMSTDKSVCLALSRTEYLDEKTQWIDKIAWENGEFADAWCFLSPLKIKSETFPIEIPVGAAPSCDNYMFLLLGMAYEHVFNWADKYKIYHYDICRKPEVVSTQRGKMILNDSCVVLSKDYLHSFDSSKYMIKAQDDWETLFNTIKK